jgi:nucleotide-binding universal stress UspA family protein
VNKRVLVPVDTAESTEQLLPLLAMLTGAGDHVVRFGDPSDEILSEAEAFGADTILVSTGTRSSVKRALLCSVAEAMLRRARIGVLLYRPPRGHKSSRRRVRRS